MKHISASSLFHHEMDTLLHKITNLDNLPESQKVPGVIAGVTSSQSTIYLKAKGFSDMTTMHSISVTDIVHFFSCTKLLTCIAALQLFEQGRLILDIPVKYYIPEIEQIGLIDEGSVSEIDGSFTVAPRKPKNEVTLRQLMNHTAGFSYGFLSRDYFLLHKNRKGHSTNTLSSSDFFCTQHLPLLHEPGTNWVYGHSTDWVGLVIERVSGKSLSKYLSTCIFRPLGMNSCTFRPTGVNLVKIYKRQNDGTLKLPRKYPIPVNPEIDLGGQGCFGTVGDYLKLMRSLLNYGLSPDTGHRILKSETVMFATKNSLPEGLTTGGGLLKNVLPELGNDLFSLLGCAISHSKRDNGRPEGVLYWMGFGNLYFWIDFQNNIAGFWATQILPFLDIASLQGYLQMETLAYKYLPNSNIKDIAGQCNKL